MGVVGVTLRDCSIVVVCRQPSCISTQMEEVRKGVGVCSASGWAKPAWFLPQVFKMLSNKESLDQIIVATPGLSSDPIALGKYKKT